MRKFGVTAMGLFIALAPGAVLARACGCAVFDVGTSTLLPSGPGTTLFAGYDFLDQTKNWSGTSQAPAANNNDKEIHTNFCLAGVQHMFNDDWGVMAEVPYTDRAFTTDTGSGVPTFNRSALSDIRLMGVYSGIAPDMSSGVIFGVKLPTGDHTYPNFDPDTEIGSGSTDLLLGAYKSGALTANQSFSWFGQILWQHEIATQDHYRPGAELNGAAAISYNDWSVGSNASLTPVLQFLLSERGRDGGAAGNPANTAYPRAIVSPGLSLSVSQWKPYADVEVPIYQHMNGNQLIAPYALKFIASYSL